MEKLDFDLILAISGFRNRINNLERKGIKIPSYIRKMMEAMDEISFAPWLNK